MQDGLRRQAICQNFTKCKRKEAELERFDVDLCGLLSQLQSAREAERARIARELHDEIGQSLTAIILHLDAALRCADSTLSSYLKECLAIANQAIEQMRDLYLELRPPQLDSSGLTASMCFMLARQAKAAGLVIEFAADPSLDCLPADLEITCFRVAQESVTNAVRHAHASRLTVELFKQDSGLHLIVRDDGRGFDVSAANSQALRGVTFGLVAMRERVQIAGGRLEITSSEGGGAEVHATFPLHASSRDTGSSP
jgi:signal transduction histidine kinase